jgi:hypothetical protein
MQGNTQLARSFPFLFGDPSHESQDSAGHRRFAIGDTAAGFRFANYAGERHRFTAIAAGSVDRVEMSSILVVNPAGDLRTRGCLELQNVLERSQQRLKAGDVGARNPFHFGDRKLRGMAKDTAHGAAEVHPRQSSFPGQCLGKRKHQIAREVGEKTAIPPEADRAPNYAGCERPGTNAVRHCPAAPAIRCARRGCTPRAADEDRGSARTRAALASKLILATSSGDSWYPTAAVTMKSRLP